VPLDDVVGNLPLIVRRDHRIVAAFARKATAEDWAQMRSWSDESRFTVHTVRVSGWRGGEMDPRGRPIRFNIPMSAHPKLHRELAWYATDDDAVPGVVILDLAYKNSSWAVLTQSDQAAGYTTADMGQSPLPTEEDATAALHDAMRLARGNR
jgi:hypothetical protein